MRALQSSCQHSADGQASTSQADSVHSDRPNLKRASYLPFCSITQAAPRPSAEPSVPSTAPASASSSSTPSSAPADKPAHDVVAGAMARAASQSTIHPLDTMKVRMQAGKRPQTDTKPGMLAGGGGPGASGRSFRVNAAGVHVQGSALQRGLSEVASLYKGVVSAATGAGIIIGAYFAFYSTTKKFLRENTRMHDGSIAFVSGATAAVGSSVVKVPIAVCIRSVQAGVYPNVVMAAKSITRAAGPAGLFTGFLPTLLEDAPDMAVKFAVYEMLRALHKQMRGRDPNTLEDLLMGGSAGAAAAAATTPLDVVKTRMMCSASSKPTFAGAVRAIMAQGGGAKDFFRGVGPRALSNGLNSAIFFCFFEAIRRVLVAQQQEKLVQQALAAEQQQREQQQEQHRQHAGGSSGAAPVACLSLSTLQRPPAAALLRSRQTAESAGAGRLACLSLAMPPAAWQHRS